MHIFINKFMNYLVIDRRTREMVLYLLTLSQRRKTNTHLTPPYDVVRDDRTGERKCVSGNTSSTYSMYDTGRSWAGLVV